MARVYTASSIALLELLVREIAPDLVAVRSWRIGGRQQFMTLLEHFRSEFFLARPQKINGLDWLVLLSSQRDAVEEFCRKHGLRVVQDGS